MALVAGAFALIVQTWAQAHLTPTRAAIAMTMEPVFASTFAVLFGTESVTGADAVRWRSGDLGDVPGRAGAAAKIEAEVPHLAQ